MEINNKYVPREGSEARQQLLLDFVWQGAALVRHACRVEDGNKNHCDDSFNVPQNIFTLWTLNHSGYYFPLKILWLLFQKLHYVRRDYLEGLFTQGSPRSKSKKIRDNSHERSLQAIRDEQHFFLTHCSDLCFWSFLLFLVLHNFYIFFTFFNNGLKYEVDH